MLTFRLQVFESGFAVRQFAVRLIGVERYTLLPSHTRRWLTNQIETPQAERLALEPARGRQGGWGAEGGGGWGWGVGSD